MRLTFCLLFCAACTFASETAKSKVHFVSITKENQEFSVPYRIQNQPGGKVVFNGGNASLIQKDGKQKEFKYVGVRRLVEVGTVDLEGQGNEDIFYITMEGNTEEYWDYHILNPRKAVDVILGFETGHGSPYITRTTSDNFNDSGLQEEKYFLEQITHEYGYGSAEQIDKNNRNAREQTTKLKEAETLWDKENAGRQEGVLQLHPVKGKPGIWRFCGNNIVIGDLEYQAGCPKDEPSVVVAYDKKTKEYFVVYHGTVTWEEIKVSNTGVNLLIESEHGIPYRLNTKTWHYTRRNQVDNKLKKVSPQ